MIGITERTDLVGGTFSIKSEINKGTTIFIKTEGEKREIEKRGGVMMNEEISRYQDLEVFKKAFAAGREIYEFRESFHPELQNTLTEQIFRSSRLVWTYIAEGWGKRRFEGVFIAKLNEAISEAAATQNWLEFSVSSGYLAKETGLRICTEYDEIISLLGRLKNKLPAEVLPAGN